MTTYTPTATTSLRDFNPTIQAGAAATGTSANATLTSITLTNATALYEVSVYAFLSGTVTAADASNMVVKQGSTTLMVLPVVQGAVTSVLPVTVVVNAATNTAVSVAVGAGTPGVSCGYNAALVARQITA